MTSIRLRLTAALVGALALAGCTAAEPQSSGTPTPSPTSCTLDAADITWGALAPAESADVGFRTITIDAAGFRISSDTERDWQSTVQTDAAELTTPDAIETLVASLNDTDQSPVDLGARSLDFSQADAEPNDPGQYILGFLLEQVQADFDAVCGGEDLGSGTLVTSGGSLSATLVACGEPTVGGGVYAEQLQAECPEG